MFLKGCGLTGRLDMSLANDVQEVGRVIDSLEEFGAAQGIAPEQSLRFGLALDELITNIISHGLAGQERRHDQAHHRASGRRAQR